MNHVGELLGSRYRLERELGSGAMGVVWQAVDERLHRTVAVKQLISQYGLDSARAEEARQRAEREGRIAARLHHSNAVAVYDVTEHDGLPVLVMEYVPSRSLADVLSEEGRLPPERVAEIGAQAASALAAAHEAGIVHRDIKPANILLGGDGTVKITDFGISRAVGDVAVTESGILAGTPAYLAPEIARGYPPTPSADVFSLGATLYAAVEGSPPFGDQGDNPLALLHLVAAAEVAEPRHAGALGPVLMRMLEADADSRPGAGEVRGAMRAVAEGQPLPQATQRVRAVPASNGTLLDARPVDHQPKGRRRYLYVGAAVALVLLLAGFLLVRLGWNNDPARQATERPIPPARLERVASDYYQLLPERAEAAWTHLAPKMRQQGRASYQNHWSNIADATVFSAPRTTGKNTVHIGVELLMPNGTKVRQFHQLGFTVNTGVPLISADLVLHSENIAPPPPPVEHGNDGDHGNDGHGNDGNEGNEGHGNGGDEKPGKDQKENED